MRKTLNLTLMNTGTASTSDLVATLPASAIVIAPSGPQSYGVMLTMATPGASTTLKLGGKYTGGTFSNTKRATVP